MIESYVFLAAFAVQIFVGSVLSPARLVRYYRAWRPRFASDLFSQLYPDHQYASQSERFIRWYRAANVFFVVVGTAVLVWLVAGLQRPDFLEVAKQTAILYFALQVSPMALLAGYAITHYKALNPVSPLPRRKATLQRRGLFDYVSPFTVAFAGASYVSFVAFALYVDLVVWHNATPSKNCIVSIGAVTLVYLLDAFIVYKYLYGKKNPLMTAEGREHSIARTVRGSVFSAISVAWFVMLIGTLNSAALKTWEPVSLSVFFSFTGFLSFCGFTRSKRQGDDVAPSEVAP